MGMLGDWGGGFASYVNVYKIPCYSLGKLVSWMQISELNRIKDV